MRVREYDLSSQMAGAYVFFELKILTVIFDVY